MTHLSAEERETARDEWRSVAPRLTSSSFDDFWLGWQAHHDYLTAKPEPSEPMVPARELEEALDVIQRVIAVDQKTSAGELAFLDCQAVLRKNGRLPHD